MNYRCEILHRLIVDRSLRGGLHKAHKVTGATIVRKGDGFNAHLHAKLVPRGQSKGSSDEKTRSLKRLTITPLCLHRIVLLFRLFASSA